MRYILLLTSGQTETELDGFDSFAEIYAAANRDHRESHPNGTSIPDLMVKRMHRKASEPYVFVGHNRTYLVRTVAS